MTDASLEALDDARALVEGPLRSALDRLDAQTRLVCGYHLGFWGPDGEQPPTPSPYSGGKRVRPALALLSARAAGAPAERGVPAAVACELVHNFSLLHDDLMDGDTERHHRETAWTKFGASAAILAGDAMLALAGEVLSEASTATAAWASRCLNATTRRLVAGQAADLAFESRDDVSLDECWRMADDKTGALLACSASLGAVLVDAPADLALALADFGTHLGLAFQLTDDLLGIWGTPDRTGKPVWSDLRARKKSLPVVAALESQTPAAEELRDIYLVADELSEADLSRAAALVEDAGGRGWAEAAVGAQSAAALQVLEPLDLPNDVRIELAALTAMLSGRDF